MKVSKNVFLSNLFYVDDVFLFGKAIVTNIDIMKETLEEFNSISGLHVFLQILYYFS